MRIAEMFVAIIGSATCNLLYIKFTDQNSRLLTIFDRPTHIFMVEASDTVVDASRTLFAPLTRKSMIIPQLAPFPPRLFTTYNPHR